jgi:hypothetical protein
VHLRRAPWCLAGEQSLPGGARSRRRGARQVVEDQELGIARTSEPPRPLDLAAWARTLRPDAVASQLPSVDVLSSTAVRWPRPRPPCLVKPENVLSQTLAEEPRHLRRVGGARREGRRVAHALAVPEDRPGSWGSRPRSAFRSVVFPEPIRPVITVIVPRSTSKLTSSTPRPDWGCRYVRPSTLRTSSRSEAAFRSAGRGGGLELS